MIGVDTNLLARYLLRDDSVQYRQAVAALGSGEDVFIPVTVLLELAWVLRSRDSTREEILRALREIIALPHVHAQHAESVRSALDWVNTGMDIADAFHLALSGKASKFLSFDKNLASHARRAGAQPPVAAP